MSEWLVAVLTLVGSAIISTAVGFLVKRSMSKYFSKRDKEQEAKEATLAEAQKIIEAEKEKKLEDTINRVVQAHTDPIDGELEKINTKLGKVADGTLDTLRDRILSSYYKCLEKGYRTQYDIDNVKHMHIDYLALDGNTFVAECMEKFKKIPTEEEYKIAKRKARKPRAKKQILNESK